MHTADLESILERHGAKMHLYADDTQRYHHPRTINLEQVMVKFEACLEDIVQWSSQRRLKLNPTKTDELIWLDRAHAIKRLPQRPRLRMISNVLTSSSSVRALGVICRIAKSSRTYIEKWRLSLCKSHDIHFSLFEFSNPENDTVIQTLQLIQPPTNK